MIRHVTLASSEKRPNMQSDSAQWKVAAKSVSVQQQGIKAKLPLCHKAVVRLKQYQGFCKLSKTIKTLQKVRMNTVHNNKISAWI